MTSEGYLLLAFGQPHYLDMALACAASIRHWDSSRRIQLVTDQRAYRARAISQLFDIVCFEEMPGAFPGPLVKLCVQDFSVFDRTMFVDADCFLMKEDIDSYWQRLADYEVTTPGEWVSEGTWYGTDIARICEAARVEKIVKMNSGVLYCQNTAGAGKFFDAAKQAVMQLGNFLNHTHRGTGLPDEPYLAIAFSRTGLQPFDVRAGNGDAWMLSTIDARDFDFDPNVGRSSFEKGGYSSPSIAHFVGMWPRDEYKKLERFYRSAFGRR